MNIFVDNIMAAPNYTYFIGKKIYDNKYHKYKIRDGIMFFKARCIGTQKTRK